MRITLFQLEQLEACKPQRELFSELFPSGEVEVTRELCEAHAELFDFEWAAENLLSGAAYVEWCKARDVAYVEWRKACAIAFANAVGNH